MNVGKIRVEMKNKCWELRHWKYKFLVSKILKSKGDINEQGRHS